MEYRVVRIEVKHEEPIVLPAAVLEAHSEYVVLRVMRFGGDPSPRSFVLRRSRDNGLTLEEIFPETRSETSS